jgi:hypothetical protein
LKNGDFWIYPYVSVEAKTARTKCSGPNVLGIAKKIFPHAKLPDGDEAIDRLKALRSVRSLISVFGDYKLVSCDISGLDLGVIAAGLSKIDPHTYWLELFRKHGPKNRSIDTHMGLLNKVSPQKYAAALSGYKKFLPAGCDAVNFFVTKANEGRRAFISKGENEEFVAEVSDFNEADKHLEVIRAVMKVTNLSIPYNQGAARLARELSSLGIEVTSFEAKHILDEYHRAFPEIRILQDRLANAVYHQGFYDTPFGRRIYADVWDEMNSVIDDQYEFVLRDGHKFWFLKFRSWKKAQGDVFEKLKVVKHKSVFGFLELLEAVPLDPRIFREKESKSRSPYRRKSESQTEEQSDFELNGFEIQNEIDRSRKFPSVRDKDKIVETFFTDGVFEVPQNLILLYRVNNGRPASTFFRKFQPLSKVGRSFFAIYCQSEAAIIAKICFNEILYRLDRETKSGKLLAFIHDQYVAKSEKSEEGLVTEILSSAITNLKPILDGSAYPVEFSGETKVGRSYS